MSLIPWFEASLWLYVLAALFSLLLCGKNKLCVIVSNIICMLAGACGLVSSLLHLLSRSGVFTIHLFNSGIPIFRFDLRIDGLSSFFLLGLSVITVCVSLYSIGYMAHHGNKGRAGLFQFLYCAFMLSMVLVLTSGNALIFLFSWEVMSAVSYFLVVTESEKEKNRRAGILYLIMTGIGTAFLLVAFLLMYGYTGSFDPSAGAESIPPGARNLMFVLFLIGFGTKAGIIPLHIWLPAAHPAAPSNVSALMSGVMIKTAIYGILRYVFGYLGMENAWWGVTLLAVGMVSAVLGVAYTMIEHDMKRLLAYSSIENIGIILIGAGIGLIAFAGGNMTVGSLALTASLCHTLNHTLFKSGLFLGAGSVQYATGVKDMEKLGGLIRKIPATALWMLCFSIAISALAPFNGFVGEWLTFQSVFGLIKPGQGGLNTLAILAVAALALSGALAAACFAKLFGISFLGKPRSGQALQVSIVPRTMEAGMGILVILCLGAGLFPMAVIHVIEPVIAGLGGVSFADGNGFFASGMSLSAAGGSITPMGLLAVLAGIGLMTLAVIRVTRGKWAERRYGTWDCGFADLTPRMQYTATGFSKPLKIVFRLLYRPSRELKKTGGIAYHPERMEYTVGSESVIEKYIYEPLTSCVKRLSAKVKDTVQTGSIRRYLAYIFLALAALMIYNRFA